MITIPNLNKLDPETRQAFQALMAQLGTVPSLVLSDGIPAPTSHPGQITIYVDAADGDLKVVFGDGFTATIKADS